MHETSQQLIDQIVYLSDRPASLNDAQIRSRISQLAKQLALSTQAPEDIANEVAYYPIYAFAVRVAIDLALFQIISASPSGASAAHLAKKSGASIELVVRTLRVLSALGFVNEIDEGVWSPNETTKVMSRPEAQAAHVHKWDNCNGTMVKMPFYLKENKYKVPTDPAHGPFQYAFGTKKTAFEYWAEHPEVAANFNTFMKGKRASRPSWSEWWPVEGLLSDHEEQIEHGALLVDVGGGTGHDIQCFRDKFAGRGRLVLEDVPSVIDGAAGLSEDIDKVKYDFFTPQPIEGARIYFFGMILHDWSDSYCLDILSQTVGAMKRGYSKILIDDAFLPTQGCPAILGALDLAMMAMHAGKERTQRQWRELLGQAGLRICKFWPYEESGATGIIEAELA